MNEDGYAIGEEKSWEADDKQPAYKSKESNRTLQVSIDTGEIEESQESDSKRCAIDKTTKMLAVELCTIEKKEDRKNIDNVIKKITSDDFNKKAFLKHIRNLGDYKEICRSIVQKLLLSICLRKKLSSPVAVSLARYMSEM